MEFSWQRGRILAIIKKHQPISVTDTAKKANISTGSTIYRYLEELKSRGLITIEKQNKKRGRPVMLNTTPKAVPLDLRVFEAGNKLKSLFGKKSS